MPTVAGGTAVSGGRLPILPLAGGAVIVLGIILYFVLGNSNAAKPKAPEAEPAAVDQPVAPSVDTPRTTPVPVPSVDRDTNRIDPTAVARDLERALRNQRLWSKIEVIGNDVEITSGSCRDAAMGPTIDAASSALRNAGLTRLRCLENSGAVVFERGI